MESVRHILPVLTPRLTTCLSHSVYYDGKQMLSRLGNPFTPPEELVSSERGSA